MSHTPAERVSNEEQRAVQRISEALRGLRFGSVNVIVQDGVVVQVERTEKLRVRQRESEQ